jgi:hypothetical protein
MHHLEEVVDTLITPGFGVDFMSDASNSYWAIPMKASDFNKTGFLTPNRQWVYLRMDQGLKGAPYTYAQSRDLVFGPLPKNSQGVKRMPTLIGRFKDYAFQIFMDDHSAAARDFESMYTFLLEEYFPRVASTSQGPKLTSSLRTSSY